MGDAGLTHPGQEAPGGAQGNPSGREGRMKRILLLAAVGEAVTGLGLLVNPPLVVGLLFGAGVTGTGIIACRVAGISLIALGLACRPGGAPARALWGMLTYSTLVALYLAWLGIGGEWTGVLLWPAAGAHAVLSLALAGAWVRQRGKAEA